MEHNTIVVNGVEYITKNSIAAQAPNVNGLTYCVIRTKDAGVFAGYVDMNNVGEMMTVTKCRRLWRWWSNFTLSALATTGMKKGKEKENQYSVVVDSQVVLGVIEVIPCTKYAITQLSSHPAYVAD